MWKYFFFDFERGVIIGVSSIQLYLHSAKLQQA